MDDPVSAWKPPIRTVAIVGASGSVGRLACRAARHRGLNVVAIDRADDDRESDEGIVHRCANVLTDDLTPMLDGCDAVISTLGLTFGLRNVHQPPPVYSRGTAAIMAAMRRHGVKRLAVVSAAFVVPQRSLPLWFALTVVPALHSVLQEMRAMERLVTTSDLDWTIARPGWLLDAPAAGSLRAGDRLLPDGAFRCREDDLARFLVDAVVSGDWVRRKPAVGAPERAIDESPLALAKAVAAMTAAGHRP